MNHFYQVCDDSEINVSKTCISGISCKLELFNTKMVTK